VKKKPARGKRDTGRQRYEPKKRREEGCGFALHTDRGGSFSGRRKGGGQVLPRKRMGGKENLPPYRGKRIRCGTIL